MSVLPPWHPAVFLPFCFHFKTACLKCSLRTNSRSIFWIEWIYLYYIKVITRFCYGGDVQSLSSFISANNYTSGYMTSLRLTNTGWIWSLIISLERFSSFYSFTGLVGFSCTTHLIEKINDKNDFHKMTISSYEGQFLYLSVVINRRTTR